MSHVDENGNLWIMAEPSGLCDLCGSVEETRPYGPGGKQVCFDCGMKDPDEVERQFELRLMGEVA